MIVTIGLRHNVSQAPRGHMTRHTSKMHSCVLTAASLWASALMCSNTTMHMHRGGAAAATNEGTLWVVLSAGAKCGIHSNFALWVEEVLRQSGALFHSSICSKHVGEL